MDDSDEMLARLQALLGEDNQEAVYEAPSTFEPFMFPTPAPKDQDPLTDSDDDEYITSEACQKQMGNPTLATVAVAVADDLEETPGK